MTIHFKNKETKEITDEQAKAIAGVLKLTNGEIGWVVFRDGGFETGEPKLMINMKNVDFID